MPLELRPRVLLADNHAGILVALQRLLEPACEVVGRVSDGAALLDAATKLRPDIVVVDISMPQINGLEACRRIKHQTPQTKVVVLTAANDEDVRQHAFNVGASAFVLKYAMVDELMNAIQKAISGDADCSQ
jgi:DNA-binding NarL/FixJ family response regulator